MSQSYKAMIHNGQIIWLDAPLKETNAKVMVTVLSPLENKNLSTTSVRSKKRQLGFMQGEMTLPEDINWGDAQIRSMFGEE